MGRRLAKNYGQMCSQTPDDEGGSGICVLPRREVGTLQPQRGIECCLARYCPWQVCGLVENGLERGRQD